MKITISRSGGFAGLTRVWAADVSDSQQDSLRTLVDSCPWEETRGEEPSPDRYVYVIEVDQRRITLGENALTEPWKTLVAQTQQADAARHKANGEAGTSR